MHNRWDRILDIKPVPVVEHLLAEASRLLAADLSNWPLEVLDIDASTGAAVATLLAQPTRPGPGVFRQAIQLTRWDLGRDFEAIDDYWRNERLTEAGLTMAAKPMVLFLSRFITEQLLAFGEATSGRVTRARLLDVLARIERHLAAKELL